MNKLRVPSYKLLSLRVNTAQKMKFSIKDYFSKYDQIHRKLQIWSHLLRKSLMENFIFLRCEFIAGVTSYDLRVTFIARVASYFLNTSYELQFIAQVKSYVYCTNHKFRVTLYCASYKLLLAYLLLLELRVFSFTHSC